MGRASLSVPPPRMADAGGRVLIAVMVLKNVVAGWGVHARAAGRDQAGDQCGGIALDFQV